MFRFEIFYRAFETVGFLFDDVEICGATIFWTRERGESFLDVLYDDFFAFVVEASVFLCYFLVFRKYRDNFSVDYRLAKRLDHIEYKCRVFIIDRMEKRVVNIEAFFYEGGLDAVVEYCVSIIESLIDGIGGVFVCALEWGCLYDYTKSVPVELRNLAFDGQKCFGIWCIFDFGDETLYIVDVVS